MADDVTATSTEAATTQPTVTETATDEIGFTAPGAVVAETTEAKPEDKPTAEKVADSPAAIKLAAKASKEARDARKALEITQKELADLRAAGGTQNAQAALDEIKANPGKLLGMGLTADQILKAVLDPDGTPKEADPALKALSDEVAALKAKNEADAKAAEERETAAKKEQESAVTKRAHEKVAGHITSFAEEFPFVDGDDSAEITNAIVDWCEKNSYKIKGDEDVKHFVKQAAQKLNEKREKRFGPRMAKKTGEGQRMASNGGLGFTDAKKTPIVATAKPSAPTSLSQPTDPLPTPRKMFEIGFTK